MQNKSLSNERETTWALFGNLTGGYITVALVLSLAVTSGSVVYHAGNALALVGVPYAVFFAFASWGIYRQKRLPGYTWYSTIALTAIWMNMFWLYHAGQHQEWGVNVARLITVAALAFWLYQGLKDRQVRRQ